MREIEVRLAGIRREIAAALRRAGDDERDVTLVAVTKKTTPAVVEAIAAAGVLDVGESRVQEAFAKAPAVQAPVRWHLIGHLQRNKVRRAVELFTTIHSVDSPRLAEAIGATGRPVPVFLQINVSGESTKAGAAPDDARALWQAALAAGVPVLGLMTMAPFADDPEAARPVFRALRQVATALNQTGDGPPLTSLSMGMSGDYVVAVEEGATHVRIGSALVQGIVPGSR